MKRFLIAPFLLLAACAPGPQQAELEPLVPVTAPTPEESSVTVVPTDAADAVAPDMVASGGAGGAASAPTSDPVGTLSISADNQTFVTNVAGEVTPVTIAPGGTFYLRLEFTDPDGISAAQVELRNSDDRGTLPRGPFTISSSDCESAVAAVPTELTCTVTVAVAPDAQNIVQTGESAYAFRPRVTDGAGNGDLAFSWAYLVVGL